jgi:hypothetical protein
MPVDLRAPCARRIPSRKPGLFGAALIVGNDTTGSAR